LRVRVAEPTGSLLSKGVKAIPLSEGVRVIESISQLVKLVN